MCALKGAQVHERPFRAAKEPVQPLAALDSFLPNGKKILICPHLSSMGGGARVYCPPPPFPILSYQHRQCALRAVNAFINNARQNI